MIEIDLNNLDIFEPIYKDKFDSFKNLINSLISIKSIHLIPKIIKKILSLQLEQHNKESNDILKILSIKDQTIQELKKKNQPPKNMLTLNNNKNDINKWYEETSKFLEYKTKTDSQIIQLQSTIKDLQSKLSKAKLQMKHYQPLDHIKVLKVVEKENRITFKQDQDQTKHVKWQETNKADQNQQKLLYTNDDSAVVDSTTKANKANKANKAAAAVASNKAAAAVVSAKTISKKPKTISNKAVVSKKAAVTAKIVPPNKPTTAKAVSIVSNKPTTTEKVNKLANKHKSKDIENESIKKQYITVTDSPKTLQKILTHLMEHNQSQKNLNQQQYHQILQLKFENKNLKMENNQLNQLYQQLKMKQQEYILKLNENILKDQEIQMLFDEKDQQIKMLFQAIETLSNSTNDINLDQFTLQQPFGGSDVLAGDVFEGLQQEEGLQQQEEGLQQQEEEDEEEVTTTANNANNAINPANNALNNDCKFWIAKCSTLQQVVFKLEKNNLHLHHQFITFKNNVHNENETINSLNDLLCKKEDEIDQLKYDLKNSSLKYDKLHFIHQQFITNNQVIDHSINLHDLYYQFISLKYELHYYHQIEYMSTLGLFGLGLKGLGGLAKGLAGKQGLNKLGLNKQQQQQQQQGLSSINQVF